MYHTPGETFRDDAMVDSLINPVQVGSGSGISSGVGDYAGYPSKGKSLDAMALHMVLTGRQHYRDGLSARILIQLGMGKNLSVDMISGFALVGIIEKQVTPLKLRDINVYRDWGDVWQQVQKLSEDYGTPYGRPQKVVEKMQKTMHERNAIPRPASHCVVDYNIFQEKYYEYKTTFMSRRTNDRWGSVWICYCGFGVWRSARKLAGKDDFETIF